MKLKNITNLDLAALIENSTELFVLPDYKDKKYVEAFLGLAVNRSYYYGKLYPDGTTTSLDTCQTVFDSDANITLLIEGILLLKNTPTNIGGGNIVYSGYGVLEVDGTVVYDGRGGSGSGGMTTFVNDVNVVLDGGRTLGPYSNGDTIPTQGLTFEQAFNLIAQEFLVPNFSSFNIGQSSPVEVGTEISGSKTFTWATSNSSNVLTNSLVIRDTTNAVDLGTGLSNNGSESLTIGTIQKNNESIHNWRITLTDTNGGTDNQTDSVLWRYFEFYGPTSAAPTDDTEVRALPSKRYTNANNSFTLNTGTSESNFALVLPPGKTLTSVIDATALNADITNSYVSQGSVTVVDAGSNNVTYTLYLMTIAGTYSKNHEHNITLAG